MNWNWKAGKEQNDYHASTTLIVHTLKQISVNKSDQVRFFFFCFAHDPWPMCKAVRSLALKSMTILTDAQYVFSCVSDYGAVQVFLNASSVFKGASSQQYMKRWS